MDKSFDSLGSSAEPVELAFLQFEAKFGFVDFRSFGGQEGTVFNH